MTQGERRFRVGEIGRELLYLTAEVEYIDDVDDMTNPVLLERAQRGYARLLQLAQEASGTRFEGTPPENSFQIAQSAALQLEVKQQLLEMMSEDERLDALCGHFDQLVPELEARRAEKRKVHSNGRVEH
jgi:DNA-binding SARP family transcriptional activator